MRVISTCGLTSMDDDKSLPGTKYSAFMQTVLKLDRSVPVKQATATKLGLALDSPTITKFEWLGLFSADAVIPPKVFTALDAVCHLMEEKMQYAQGEKDMILMKHIFEVSPSGLIDRSIDRLQDGTELTYCVLFVVSYADSLFGFPPRNRHFHTGRLRSAAEWFQFDESYCIVAGGCRDACYAGRSAQTGRFGTSIP